MPSTFSLPLWAAQVAAATPLPDSRLNTRLERLLTQLASKPLDAIPQTVSDWHQAKATYRFLSNNRFGHDDLLTGWRATTTSALVGRPAMTEDSLFLIESRLGITLPESYRALHHDHADRLQQLDWSGEAINPLYLTAEHVIAPNIEERRPEMGTGCAFPNWWESFFLIGTNGGGDYYSLRLDNTEGVWLIGSDCGETPTRVADTLQQYVEQTIAEHEVAKALEAERVRKRAPFRKE